MPSVPYGLLCRRRPGSGPDFGIGRSPIKKTRAIYYYPHIAPGDTDYIGLTALQGYCEWYVVRAGGIGGDGVEAVTPGSAPLEYWPCW